MVQNVKMTRQDFEQLGTFVNQLTGIKMPEGKMALLESRLQKRLRELGFQSFGNYYQHVAESDREGQELISMIDAVTTNKTDFFREAAHFDYLANLLDGSAGTYTTATPLRIWSAGCSSGEEPYTLCMVLEWLGQEHYEVLATDISSRVLEKARLAVYDEARVLPVPEEMRKRYLLRSKDREKPTVRVVPALRKRVRLERLNFMDESYILPYRMHVVFCRNVLIYFDKPTQEAVLAKICDWMLPGAILFLGHSESILSMRLPLRQLQPTIYQRL